jgi:type I restriction enzyme, R subunit
MGGQQECTLVWMRRPEADTCREYVVPRLVEAGWEAPPRSFVPEHRFTDGRIVVAGETVRRQPRKRADYLLRYTPDFAIAVVEAKSLHRTPGQGLQQAKQYAETLGLKFAYVTNGRGIIEYDFTACRRRWTR